MPVSAEAINGLHNIEIHIIKLRIIFLNIFISFYCLKEISQRVSSIYFKIITKKLQKIDQVVTFL